MSTARKKVRRAGSGPHIQDQLNAHGIPIRQVVKRRSGEYVGSVFVPEMLTPVEPASHWKKKLEGFTGVRVIHHFDTHAHWREGKPVIEATLKFVVKESELTPLDCDVGQGITETTKDAQTAKKDHPTPSFTHVSIPNVPYTPRIALGLTEGAPVIRFRWYMEPISIITDYPSF